MDRRDFLQTSKTLLAAGMITAIDPAPSPTLLSKKKLAMVGTGVRGIGMWGTPVISEFAEQLEFVGLCDINPGRLAVAKEKMKLQCRTYTDFDTMMRETKPDILLVMTVDGTHHDFIIKGMEYGADIITEKPMTVDEEKCQQIIDAEKRTGRTVKVTFNYRYSPHRQKIYELLRQQAVGKITSVDFHWYLDTYHGADYFRRWHRLRKNSGTLLVHKATHHFDLLNWWLNSEPEEIFAYGSLDHYGKNNPFRHTNCRPCPHKEKCSYYFDITKDKWLVDLYVANEKHDGYLRDGCVWKEDIDIYDKMAVQIRYSNQVQVSYSLTTYSPYEGYRIAFNGTEGRIEAWIKERAMSREEPYDEIAIFKNFGKKELIRISNTEGGHGGGDQRLRKQIFSPSSEDTYHQAAGSRDGAMSILIGIAARKSIENGQPVKIESLTSLQPKSQRT